MSFEIPLDEVDTGRIGGFDKVEPGYFHFVITALDEEGGKKGEMVVDMDVLRGSVPGQEGKSHRENFSRELKSTPIRKLLALAIACEITTKEDLDKMRAAGTRPELDFSLCVGKQVCARIETNEHQGTIYHRVAWDEIWHPTDKRANRTPLAMDWIKSGGYVLPEGRNPDGVLAAKADTTSKPPAGKKTTGLEQPAQTKETADDPLAGVV